jgi:hypothetical protein
VNKDGQYKKKKKKKKNTVYISLQKVGKVNYRGCGSAELDVCVNA